MGNSEPVRIIDAENTNGRMMDEANLYQVMPPLAEEEYQALKADIAERGVVVPVVLDGAGSVIDGHHRIRAWGELRGEGRDVPDYPRITRSDLRTEAEKREEAWRLNMQRRHLNQAQKRDAIAAKLKESPEWADHRIGKLLGVDGKTVRSVRIGLEIREEVPTLEKLVGADGKEYPRHRAQDLEDQLRYQEERQRKEIRRELLSPTGKHRSDAQIAEEFEVPGDVVAEQRKALAQEGPTIGEALEGNPQMARELGGNLRDLAKDHKEAEVLMHASHALTGTVLAFSKAAPEDVARYVLSNDVAEKARENTRPTRSGPHTAADIKVEQARRAISWLERYVAALEEGSKPSMRVVK